MHYPHLGGAILGQQVGPMPNVGYAPSAPVRIKDLSSVADSHEHLVERIRAIEMRIREAVVRLGGNYPEAASASNVQAMPAPPADSAIARLRSSFDASDAACGRIFEVLERLDAIV